MRRWYVEGVLVGAVMWGEEQIVGSYRVGGEVGWSESEVTPGTRCEHNECERLIV